MTATWFPRSGCAAPPVIEPQLPASELASTPVPMEWLSGMANCQGFTQMSTICSSQQRVARSTSRSCPRGFPSLL